MRVAGLLLLALALLEVSVASQLRLFGNSRTVNFTASDGTSLAALLYEGPRSAPGVVLVHMLGRSKQDWVPFAERLQEAGATVLVLDLRGHGQSGGSAAALPPMAEDVRSAIYWLAARGSTRSDVIGVVGASLGANLAAIVGSQTPSVRAVALISPSMDYRGVRLDAGVVKKLEDRALWLCASTEDPYALRTIKELLQGTGTRAQYLTGIRGHGTPLILRDPDASRALVDWLKQTLIF